ncbi:MAG: hypothetical protein J0L75_15285 [Spirochaetes bacterium]|nr:hypothetical protein [Spirochaetota bacterium]
MLHTLTPQTLTSPIADIRRDGERTTISLKPGVHHIVGDFLSERLCAISNNDSGIKRVLVDLTGARHVDVEGNGAELRIHGLVVPFLLRGARDVSIRNVTIDWDRPTLSQGLVEAAREGAVELRFDAETPFEVASRQLVFTGDRYRSRSLGYALAFDPKRGETSYLAPDHFALRHYHHATQIGPDRVRLEGDFNGAPPIGSLLVFSHEGREAPAIAIADCRDIALADIKIYHAAAMGVIAQGSANLTLTRVDIMRRPGSERVFSTHADATHFVDCRGRLRITDCLMENQKDDPCNLHGIFYPVRAKLGDRTLAAGIGHGQQAGCVTFAAGDAIAWYDTQSMRRLGASRVAEVSLINGGMLRVETHDPLPELPWERLSFMREDHDIDVAISGCTFRNNRARGLLVSTLGKVLIEKNHFHVPGAALLFEGDTNYWFESGPVEDVEVRDNFFDECNYGVWGKALFQFTPRVPRPEPGLSFHRNIRIHHNRIKAIFYPLLHAESVEGLSFTENRVEKGDSYPLRLGAAPFSVQPDCSPVVEKGNLIPS